MKLKSMMLGSTVIFRRPDDELGTDTQTNDEPVVKTKQELAKEEREKIKVVSSTPEKKEEEEPKKEEEKEEPKKEDEIEASEEKEEELEEELEAATDKKEKAKIQRRIDREVAKRKELQDELVLKNAEIAALKAGGNGETLTQADVEKRAKEIAIETVAAQQFQKDCDKLTKQATKVDKDFEDKLEDMTSVVAKIPGRMIGILSDLDNNNGGEVLSYLTGNHDEYEDILKLPPERMAIKLSKISDKLEADKKPKPKVHSKVPPPNDPLKPNTVTAATIPTNFNAQTDMDKFVKIRAKQDAERRAIRGH